MSHQLLKLSSRGTNQEIHFTSTYGGSSRGRCVQITIEDQYVVMNKSDIQNILMILDEWIKGGE